MKPIYKTAGTTPRERWKNRAQVIALLILGWGVGGIGLGVASTRAWHSGVLPLWVKIVFTLWTLIVLSFLACMTADAARTSRNDWILYKARSRNR